MNTIAIPMNNGNKNFHVNHAYINYIAQAGYMPFGVFDKEVSIEKIVEHADGLLLPGGIDIDPVYYDEDNLQSYSVDPEKDAFERNLLYAFTAAGKPVFGICRGFQMMARELLKDKTFGAVLKDFTFYQHINGHATNEKVGAGRNVKTHSVIANRGRLYKNEFGSTRSFTRQFVNSMHHQGLIVEESALIKKEDPAVAKKEKRAPNFTVQDQFSTDFTILAYTSFAINAANVKKEDREIVVESFEARFGNSLVRGVQWHPEEINDTELLKTYFDSFWADNSKTKVA